MAALVLVEEGENGERREIQTVEVPKGLNTVEAFSEWIERTMAREASQPYIPQSESFPKEV